MNEATKRIATAILVVVLAFSLGVATGAGTVWKYYVKPERAKSSALDTELQRSGSALNGAIERNRQLERGLAETQRIAGECVTTIKDASSAAGRIADTSVRIKYLVNQLRIVIVQLYKLIGKGTVGG